MDHVDRFKARSMWTAYLNGLSVGLVLGAAFVRWPLILIPWPLAGAAFTASVAISVLTHRQWRHDINARYAHITRGR